MNSEVYVKWRMALEAIQHVQIGFELVSNIVAW
jgi:hypothetical protein